MAEASPDAVRRIRYTDALNEALREEMLRDETVFVMGEDIARWGDGGGVFAVTKGLFDDFGPDRIRDTPISEEGIVATAVGAAVTGMRPVVELMYFDFVTLAMEPLVNQAAKLRYMFGGQASVPMVLRSNVGASGGKAAQHSQSLETWMMHVPGLKVVMPSTPYDAKGLLKTAIRDDDPVVFLEHKLLYFNKGDVPQEEYSIPFGEAAVRRHGSHVTVVANQAMLQHALAVAERLEREGVEVEVIDPRTLVPLDIATIVQSVEKTNRLVVCHEAVTRAGWAAEIITQVSELAFDFLDGPPVRVCALNAPVPYASTLESAVIPGEAEIESGIRRALAGVDLDLDARDVVSAPLMRS
jgi:acetoin:2,6-dichlorophenolindophenol oxidoreductase subunit beta